MSCKNTITTCIKCYRKINSSFNLCRYGTKSPLFISLQWGTHAWTNTSTLVNIRYPISFEISCFCSLATIVQSYLEGKSATVQISDFTNSLTELNLLYTNTNLVSHVYCLRSYWISLGK